MPTNFLVKECFYLLVHIGAYWFFKHRKVDVFTVEFPGIAVLKSKRPHVLTEEQKLDILVTYYSLQAKDAKVKELLENPEQSPRDTTSSR